GGRTGHADHTGLPGWPEMSSAGFGLTQSCRIGLATFDAGGDRGEDGDATLTFTHPPAHRVPSFDSGDPGGVGALKLDQDQVVEAVAVEAAGEAEPGPPRVGVGECGDLVDELGVQLGELVLPLLRP